MREFLKHGVRTAEGTISCELKATDYDAFLESAFFSTISTGIMKIGTTQKSFTIEERVNDLSGVYRLFTGMTVSRVGFSMNVNELVMAEFDLLGKNMVTATGSIDATPTAASGNQPMTCLNAVLNEGGSSIATVTSLDFEINNNLAANFVIGSTTGAQLENSTAMVTGNFSAYFESASLLNKFLNETASSLSVALTDGTSTYTFSMPTIKYTSHSIDETGTGSRVATIGFTALRDSSEATPIKLVKS
ncbi:MAG: hypothetical protein EBR82_10010 [Caulobacteraceae bacterium]|nr:hypothetical protein [Caulobacteraceae bacterium]